MKVFRKREVEVKNIQVGDQITVELTKLGKFTATAQKITDIGVLFMFDDCITERPMNKKLTNDGGYETSDLCEWINITLIKAFPKELKNKIKNLSLPTYGQIFSHDDFYKEAMEQDEDEQLVIMTKRKNRVCDFKNDGEWYWLRNATKKEYSAAGFAVVNYDGNANYSNASNSHGVRPVFWLIK